ncbi:3-dehydroquinate synthase [Salinimicrobium sp. 3283s]|uniref:3-dehydroquinate synthase n=1 Tax=Autumnicola psychrophila TaxID=3075592 RepID=A0ABU3DRL4_9FLAO|nr:3-dehydroquinate synthase [Zunongwangia sp. F225]MDT0686350.1 3-dehydroquinate synthase [Zunongwangia sp. F225]
MNSKISAQKTNIRQSFTLPVAYDVYFTEDLFAPANPTFKQVFSRKTEKKLKLLFVVDSGLLEKTPGLQEKIRTYCEDILQLEDFPDPIILPGGEESKNYLDHVTSVLDQINKYGISRHSFVVAIGGGAVLDAAGFAAGIAHRGVRLIRVPTTVLSQNDSGVGVKNGINWYNKKNFLGTFTPPFAVINDQQFLRTLEERDWRGGISEAVKVALIKDRNFFDWIKNDTERLVNRDNESMQYLIYRCAELHLEHISSGDAFETGSSRPLDFGHWAAHKLEQFTNYSLRHGEAVAIGISLDCVYSWKTGLIKKSTCDKVLQLLWNLGFRLYTPELLRLEEKEFEVLEGLQEFREHLGGDLTIMLLEEIGKGKEVHQIDQDKMKESILFLEKEDQKIGAS